MQQNAYFNKSLKFNGEKKDNVPLDKAVAKFLINNGRSFRYEA